jgi:hypothetical protein
VNLITSSRLRAAQACPRLVHDRYGLGLVAPSTGAMAFGTAIHAGLEAWWSTVTTEPEHSLSAALSRVDIADPFDRARAEAMLAAYDVRWRAWACGTRFLGAELEFRAPLRDPDTGHVARTWEVAGKIDALIELADGRVAIVEHKTTSATAAPGSDYRAKLTLDPQVSVYHDGAAALGYTADLCLYDVLVKPSQKPLTASAELKLKKDGAPRAGQRMADETPEEYRARLVEAISADPDRYLVHAEIVRRDRDRETHARDLWGTVATIEHHRRRLPVLPPRHASACFAHGSPCAFLPLCEGRGRIEDYARGGAHAELTQTTREDRAA